MMLRSGNKTTLNNTEEATTALASMSMNEIKQQPPRAKKSLLFIDSNPKGSSSSSAGADSPLNKENQEAVEWFIQSTDLSAYDTLANDTPVDAAPSPASPLATNESPDQVDAAGSPKRVPVKTQRPPQSPREVEREKQRQRRKRGRMDHPSTQQPEPQHRMPVSLTISPPSSKQSPMSMLKVNKSLKKLTKLKKLSSSMSNNTTTKKDAMATKLSMFKSKKEQRLREHRQNRSKELASKVTKNTKPKRTKRAIMLSNTVSSRVDRNNNKPFQPTDEAPIDKTVVKKKGGVMFPLFFSPGIGLGGSKKSHGKSSAVDTTPPAPAAPAVSAAPAIAPTSTPSSSSSTSMATKRTSSAERLGRELNIIKHAVSEKQMELEALQEENAQQHDTIAEYEHEMNTMTDRSNQLEQQILELEIAHDIVQSETIDLKNNMKALEEKHAEQIETAVHKQEKIQQDQLKEINAGATVIEELKEELDNMRSNEKKSMATHAAAVAMHENQVQALKELHETKVNKVVEESTMKINTMKECCGDDVESMQHTNLALMEEKNALETLVQQMTLNNTTLTKEHDERENEFEFTLKNMEQQLITLRKEHETAMAAAKAAALTATNVAVNLAVETATVKAATEKTAAVKKAVQAAVEVAVDNVQQESMAIQQGQLAEMNNLRNECTRVKQGNEQFKHAAVEQEAQINSMKTEAATLKTEHKEKILLLNQTIIGLKKELSEQSDVMDDALDEKQQKLKELTLKYEQLTGSTTNYEEKLKTAVEEQVKSEQCQMELMQERAEMEAMKDDEINALTAKCSTLADKNKVLVVSTKDQDSQIATLQNTMQEYVINSQNEIEKASQMGQEKVAALETECLQLRQRCGMFSTKIRDAEMLRRTLHNQVMDLRGSIRVGCRVRPRLQNEQVDKDATESYHFPDSQFEQRCLTLTVDQERYDRTVSKTHSFEFDRVFGPSSTQSHVYEEISHMVQSAVDGYNVCIFAYGQTGSGKTHTMMGGSGSPLEGEERGMMPRAAEHIFQYCQELNEQGWTFEVTATMVEIYNEQIFDLLTSTATGSSSSRSSSSSSSKKSSALNKCELRHVRNEKGEYTTCVDNAKTIVVTSTSDILALLDTAMSERSTSQTNCNQRSSRSHTVLTLSISGEDHQSLDKDVAMRQGQLNLIDLAGSERLKISGSIKDPKLLKEAQCINKSLSCLGNVVGALARNREGHVPYRDSKLTHMLQHSLGGDSKALMFCNVSPVECSLNESLTSLWFAQKVNKVERK